MAKRTDHADAALLLMEGALDALDRGESVIALRTAERMLDKRDLTRGQARKLLREAVKGRAGQQAGVAPAFTEQLHPRAARGPGGGKFISKGETSARVAAAQNRLTQLGHPTTPDGSFGPQTQQSVKDFQKKYGLPPTGHVDNVTLELMRNPPPLSFAASQAQVAALVTSAGKGLMRGARGPQVLQFQSTLGQMGYSITETGFGPQTAAAVRQVQKENGFPQTGVADPHTLALIAGLAKTAAQASIKGNTSGDQIGAWQAHGSVPRPGRLKLKHSDEEENMGDELNEASYAGNPSVAGSPSSMARFTWGGTIPAMLTGPDAPEGAEPPGLRDAGELDFARCGSCVFWFPDSTCWRYNWPVEHGAMCDDWMTVTPDKDRSSQVTRILTEMVQEALFGGVHAAYEEAKHPRGRGGKWRTVAFATALSKGDHFRLSRGGEEHVVEKVGSGAQGKVVGRPVGGGEPVELHKASTVHVPGERTPGDYGAIVGRARMRGHNVVNPHEERTAGPGMYERGAKELRAQGKPVGKGKANQDIRGPNAKDKKGQAAAAMQSASQAEARAAELRKLGNEAHAKDYDDIAARSKARAARLGGEASDLRDEATHGPKTGKANEPTGEKGGTVNPGTLKKAQDRARMLMRTVWLVPDGKGGHRISVHPEGATHEIKSGGAVKSLTPKGEATNVGRELNPTIAALRGQHGFTGKGEVPQLTGRKSPGISGIGDILGDTPYDKAERYMTTGKAGKKQLVHSRLDAVLAQLEEVSSDVYPGLDRSPKENWVDKAGGLPNYIERIAKHLHYEKGKDVSTAIAIAVNTVKRWCAGGGPTTKGGTVSHVSAKTKSQACAAVAEWEAKKGKSKASSAVKEGGWPATFADALALYESAYKPIPPSLNFCEKILGEVERSYDDWDDFVGGWSPKLLEADYIDPEAFEEGLLNDLASARREAALKWSGTRHPRGRGGKFIDVLGKLEKASRPSGAVAGKGGLGRTASARTGKANASTELKRGIAPGAVVRLRGGQERRVTRVGSALAWGTNPGGGERGFKQEDVEAIVSPAAISNERESGIDIPDWVHDMEGKPRPLGKANPPIAEDPGNQLAVDKAIGETLQKFDGVSNWHLEGPQTALNGKKAWTVHVELNTGAKHDLRVWEDGTVEDASAGFSNPAPAHVLPPKPAVPPVEEPNVGELVGTGQEEKPFHMPNGSHYKGKDGKLYKKVQNTQMQGKKGPLAAVEIHNVTDGTSKIAPAFALQTYYEILGSKSEVAAAPPKATPTSTYDDLVKSLGSDDVPSSLSGMKVVVTGKIEGMTRKEAEAMLTAAGAHVQSSVSAGTDMLITGEHVGAAKTKAAQAKGVKVFNYVDIEHLLEAAIGATRSRLILTRAQLEEAEDTDDVVRLRAREHVLTRKVLEEASHAHH